MELQLNKVFCVCVNLLELQELLCLQVMSFVLLLPSIVMIVFGQAFVKRFALCYRAVVCLTCNVGVL